MYSTANVVVDGINIDFDFVNFVEILAHNDSHASVMNTKAKSSISSDGAPHNGESSSRNNSQPQLRPECISLEHLFAEPLFSRIEFGLPSSKDYMMIEPLFLNLNLPGEFKNGSNGDDVRKIGLNCCASDTIMNNIDDIVEDEIDKINAAIEMPCRSSIISYSDVYDVTVLPGELSSYSHCLKFMSARRNRLGSLRDAAIWRAIKLLSGWIMVFLFVFWLSSILTASFFPDNPIKFLFVRRIIRKRPKIVS